MFNWLIKLLGGYTQKEFDDLDFAFRHELNNLHGHLRQARKNDTPRDPKTGRFVKK